MSMNVFRLAAASRARAGVYRRSRTRRYRVASSSRPTRTMTTASVPATTLKTIRFTACQSCEHRAEHTVVRRRYGGQREAPRAAARRRRELRAKRLVDENALERRRDGLRLMPIDEEPVDADGHDFPRSGGRRGHHGHATGHRLDQYVAEAFVARRQHEDVRPGDELPRVLLKPAEHDGFVEAAFGNLAPQLRLELPVSQEEQAHWHVSAKESDRFNQQRIVLRVRQPSCGDDHGTNPHAGELGIEDFARRSLDGV